MLTQWRLFVTFITIFKRKKTYISLEQLSCSWAGNKGYNPPAADVLTVQEMFNTAIQIKFFSVWETEIYCIETATIQLHTTQFKADE